VVPRGLGRSSTTTGPAVVLTCRSACDLLQHLAQVLVGGEQLIDLGADLLDRRYSCWHGPRPPPGVGAHGSPRLFHFPPDLDATAAFEEIRWLASAVAGSWAYSSAERKHPTNWRPLVRDRGQAGRRMTVVGPMLAKSAE
jgi:hypothetical protein